MFTAGRGGRPYLRLCGFVALLGATLLVYSQTLAFTWDEGFHLLAAQLIGAGKTPYLDFCFPQTTWNTYWMAAWMRIFGESWRLAHALAALLTTGAVMLAADYVYSRLPISRWRMAAAFTAALLIGLNSAVFEHGAVGQAYGMCLFATVAAFRAAVAAKYREGPGLPALAGFLAGVAAASSLLSAAALPVLLVWTAIGKRWKHATAFVAGALVPFLPTLWLFTRAPRQTWFNLFEYHLHYRVENWPDATQHDFEVLISWLDSGHALLLILLAVAGLLVIRAGTEWRSGVRSEFYLCGAMALTIGAEVSSTHPTFPRYYLLVVPFASILAAAGYYGVGTRLGGSVRPLWPTLAFGLLIAFGCAKMFYDRRDVYVWRDMEQVARKVREVTPAQAPLWADESIYFLTRHAPPSGMEFGYSHTIAGLTPQRSAQLHILSELEVKRLVEAGAYATVETCDLDTDFIDSLELPKLYRQHAEISDCGVYWDKVQP
jgi:hypothetical protein